jgi:thioredoxin-related protein
MRALRTGFVLSLLLLLGASYAYAGVPRDPDQYFFDTTLGDFSEELATAKQQGKKGILLFFEQEECPFCHRMKTTVLNQPEVQDFYKKNFLIFSVDIESTVEITDFHGHVTNQKAFFAEVARNRGATPVFAFFDLNGDLVVRYTGATSGVEEFMWLGEYASQGLYKKMPFTKYKREKQREERASAS